MPRNRFDGSEAADFPKGNGKLLCVYTDQQCHDMLKSLSAIKEIPASQVVRELIRQEQKLCGVYRSSYEQKDDKTPGLFE